MPADELHRDESTYPANPFAAPDPDPEPDDHDANDDAPSEPEQEPEPAPASMSMTKAELLERLSALEADQTKAQLLERIHVLEGGTLAARAEDAVAAAPADLSTRQVTIDGQTYTWTAQTEDTVPRAARDAWAQSRAAGG